MEKTNENPKEAILDFEFSESLTTPSVPFKFNIVHDYLKEKTLPQRPSLPPKFLENLTPKPIIVSRQTYSTNYKNVSKEKEEKKEVHFENNDETQENPQILDSLNLINDNDEIKQNNIELRDKEEIREDLLNLQRKKGKKNKTVIINAEKSELEKILEQEQNNDEKKSPEKETRIKSQTFSSPEKKTKKDIRNSKLFAFSKIVDPLDKIDQENQQNLDLQANKEKLIFSNEDNMDEKQKYLTFYKAKLEDFKAKMQEQDLQFGKFTCITVNIFINFNYLS